MGIKTAAEPRPAIPLQQDGRTELQELAAALSQQVEQRHRSRGAHTLEIVTGPEVHDLTAEPEPLPVREPEPLAVVVNRGVRRAVPLVLAVVVTSVVGVAGWTASHPTAAARPQAARTTSPAPVVTAPATPAEWGAAAHHRLSVGGRPVDVFACQGAYAADTAVAAGVLLPVATHADIWRAYLATCLSDMSGASAGQSG
jgi:hypothetical protein